MAITNLDGVINGLATSQKWNINKIGTTGRVAGGFTSLANLAGSPIIMGTPTVGTGRVPNNTTAGALTFSNPITNKKYIAKVSMQSSVAGTLLIYDRLWDNSGIVTNILTSQAVNSLALTRYTDGIDVEIWGEVYTVTGVTASTATVTYTDSSNVSRTATCVMSTATARVGEMFPFIPQGIANGVKSIQSIIFSASTGTAGNIGLVLVRRLAEIPIMVLGVTSNLDSFALGLPEIVSNASLFLMASSSTTTVGAMLGSINIIEG